MDLYSNLNYSIVNMTHRIERKGEKDIAENEPLKRFIKYLCLFYTCWIHSSMAFSFFFAAHTHFSHFPFLSLPLFLSNRYAWSSNNKMPTIISEWFSILKLLFVCDLILFCSLFVFCSTTRYIRIFGQFLSILRSCIWSDNFFLFLLLQYYNVKFIVPLLSRSISSTKKEFIENFPCKPAQQWFYWNIIKKEEQKLQLMASK